MTLVAFQGGMERNDAGLVMLHLGGSRFENPVAPRQDQGFFSCWQHVYLQLLPPEDNPEEPIKRRRHDPAHSNPDEGEKPFDYFHICEAKLGRKSSLKKHSDCAIILEIWNFEQSLLENFKYILTLVLIRTVCVCVCVVFLIRSYSDKLFGDSNCTLHSLPDAGKKCGWSDNQKTGEQCSAAGARR